MTQKMIENHKLYSYVVRVDSGFAPNPQGKYCTLACCKPAIRRKADEADWVIGTGPVRHNAQGKLVYAMEITKKMGFDKYFQSKRFKTRKDRVYYKGKDGKWKWKNNPYGHDSEESLNHDRSGRYVLISSNYYYFGNKAIEIPKRLREIIKKGPGHKRFYANDGIVRNFLKWLKKQKRIKIATPYGMPEILFRCSKKGIVD
jgi:hypothetical protein